MNTAEALHAKLGQVLLNALELGSTVSGKCHHCGEVTSFPIVAEARYIAEAIKWLKDNGINSIPTEGSPTSKVASKLPFPDVTEPHERAANGEGGLRGKILPFPHADREA